MKNAAQKAAEAIFWIAAFCLGCIGVAVLFGVI
jgi:hypothetical protein